MTQKIPIAAFHDHLDRCDRCCSEPFNLCPEGARLLRAAGLQEAAPPRPQA